MRRVYENLTRQLMARRKRLSHCPIETTKQLVVAQRELEDAERHLEQVRRSYELLHPTAAAARKRGGRRAAEKRAEHVDQTARFLSDFDAALFRSLAYVIRDKNGKRWADLNPNTARELFEEWVQEHEEEYQAAQAEAWERGAAEQILELERQEYERAGIDWTEEDERRHRAQLRKTRGKAPQSRKRNGTHGLEEIPF